SLSGPIEHSCNNSTNFPTKKTQRNSEAVSPKVAAASAIRQCRTNSDTASGPLPTWQSGNSGMKNNAEQEPRKSKLATDVLRVVAPNERIGHSSNAAANRGIARL